MKLRVSECFGPVSQGEGYYVGVPSIFVRFFGCNFRCPGFNVPNYNYQGNEEVQELLERIPEFNKDINQLPIVKTGCDSYYAVYPEFKGFAKDYTPEELVQEIKSKKYPRSLKAPHVVFTGGEPLLWQKAIVDLIEQLVPAGFSKFTIETNGTQVLIPDFIRGISVVKKHYPDVELIAMVSPKLQHSGHRTFETFVPQAVSSYETVCDFVFMKFVVKKDDLVKDEVLTFIKNYNSQDIMIDDVFLMPEGGNNDESYQENAKYAIQLCLEYGYRYSPRLQVELFNNGVGT